MKNNRFLKIFQGLQYLSVLLLIGANFSCNKQLTLSPTDQFNSSTFWTNQTNVLLALTAVYKGGIQTGSSSGAEEYGPTDWWSYQGLFSLEMCTDNAYDRRGDNSPVVLLTRGGLLNSSNSLLPTYWSLSYARIARCNYFLENVGKAPLDSAFLSRVIAEARFIRACQYFYLSQYFGSVPLVTTTLSVQEANTVKKTAKAQIVQYAIDEFTAAANELPHFKDLPVTDIGRACKQAALAFLGRLQLSDGRYADAAITYKTIIDYGENIIDPNYASIFQVSNENSAENIFSVQFIENLEGQAINQHFFPAVAGGWHLFCPLGNLMEAYDFTDGTPFSYTDPRYNSQNIGQNRDPRLKFTILSNQDRFKQFYYISNPDSTSSPDQIGSGKQTTNTGYGMKKLSDENASTNLYNSGQNNVIIRYAEVLLSYLEAKLEAGQAIDQGLLDATINKVRGRASVNMPPVTQTDPTLLRPILRKERRIELALEGLRYWDLLRWKIAGQVLNGDFYGAPFPGATRLNKKPGASAPDIYGRWYVTSKAFVVGQDDVWPVPQSEVNINPGLK